MSDLKRLCPACDAWTSPVGAAFRDGQPCPYCGLPADVVKIIDKAERKGIEAEVLKRLAEAEHRAVVAESESGRLTGILRRIKADLKNV